MYPPSTSEPRLAVARWISIIGHPFLLMPLLTGILAHHLLPPREAFIAACVAFGIVIIPAGIYTLLRVRRGEWRDLDVSDPDERKQFYGVLLPLLVVLCAVTWSADVPRSISIGTLAITLLVAVALGASRWVKVSLHTGFSIFVAITLSLIQPSLALAAFLLAALVAWSRIALGRHSGKEVMYGAMLGSLVGIAFAAIMRFS